MNKRKIKNKLLDQHFDLTLELASLARELMYVENEAVRIKRSIIDKATEIANMETEMDKMDAKEDGKIQ